jgi:hypothetical protein
MIKKQMTQTDNESVRLELDKVLKKRYGGAVSIRGIRYQVLYSINRAFELYNENDETTSIRLEGIEDVDISLGSKTVNEYVQVKTSQKPWAWAKLKDPIKNFLETYRVTPFCRFVLAVDFQLTKDIAKLAKMESLSLAEKDAIKKKFRQLCKDLDSKKLEKSEKSKPKKKINATDEEADSIANILTFVSLSEDKLLQQLRLSIADNFKLGSEAVDFYLLVLVAKFLEWAKDRKTVTLSQLENIRANFGEALARETEFQAYGRGLIDRISWKADAKITDFFDGKGTRPGHIVANVDVKRPIWIEKIKKALDYSKICILRSSSGQGKSALLYRYAYNYSPIENTFILKIAEFSEQVESTINYLRFRNGLGLPILLLIDNAGWQTRLWPSIVQECAALNIQVLMTIRNEDWHRFAKESLTGYEILEPILDLNEAKQIFKAFKSEKRLHVSINSPEWAYEKIGQPHLLMEYVYLLTHGRMLEERLRDQIRQFNEQKEDPIKVEILRRVALADTLGVPILSRKLLLDENIKHKLRDDPQLVLNSLNGEYINLEKEIITGLHAVRSDHITQILHEGYLNLGDTALAILDAVPPNSIVTFISNAICKEGLDVPLFIQGLIDKAKNAGFDILLAFLEGIFEAGERQFFETNKGLFDEAYQFNGSSATFLIMSDFMPVVKVNFINEQVNSITDEKREYYRRLQKISLKISKTSRGLDLCRKFLSQTISSIEQKNILQANLGNLGELLDWCVLCQVDLSVWLSVCDEILENPQIFHSTLDSFCNFTQGLYRYDEPAYHNWFSKNQQDVISYLKLHADCVELNILDNILSIKFFPNSENKNFNEQAMSRLKKLRSAIPFCEYHQSQGIWDLPVDIKLSVDDTYKNMPKKDIPYESDIRKNIVWKNVVKNYYLSDSYYQYEESWYNLRHDALRLVRGLSKGLQKSMIGKKFNFQAMLEGGQLLLRLNEHFRHIPDYPRQTPKYLEEILKGSPKRYSTSLKNFFSQLFQYVKDTNNREILRLAVINFEEATKYLPKLHNAFDQLFKEFSDYFDVRKLNHEEIKEYRILANLLHTWIRSLSNAV